MNNPFEGMTDTEIANYARKVYEDVSSVKKTEPELESIYSNVAILIAEAQKRGGLNLKITVYNDSDTTIQETWSIKVEKIDD